MIKSNTYCFIGIANYYLYYLFMDCKYKIRTIVVRSIIEYYVHADNSSALGINIRKHTP